MIKFLKRLFTSELDRKPCDHGRVGTCSLCLGDMLDVKVSECEHLETNLYVSCDDYGRETMEKICIKCGISMGSRLLQSPTIHDRNTYSGGYDA